MPRFGPAGNPNAFYDQGGKTSADMPAWLSARGLDAYEYQCGRGVNIGGAQALAIGAAAAAHGVQMSVHAPYYINLASEDPIKQEKTIGYILDSLRVARPLGARRVVLHPGSAMQAGSRAAALELASGLFSRVIAAADDEGLLGECTLCPEVMGKNNQLGDLDEVLALCSLDDRLLPCVDFGHFNARTQGGLRTTDDFRRICLTIASRIGYERLRQMHVHFSRIEFSAGGEKRHLTLDDQRFGPDFEPFAEIIVEMALEPVIICESDGTQADDAQTMRRMYEEKISRAKLGEKR